MINPENPTPAGYQPPQTVEELLQRYASGERYFVNADLPDGADFPSANLEGAILEKAWLYDVDFSGAKRDRIYYADATGIVSIGNLFKKYALAAFGKNSAEHNQVKDLEFKNHRRR
jgi:hypothetical protein